MLIPLYFVLLINGRAFGHVGVAWVILMSIGGVAQADPTLPRRVRASVLAFCVTFIFPLLASSYSGLAAYYALTLQMKGLCSMRDPTCATRSRRTAGVNMALALLTVG